MSDPNGDPPSESTTPPAAPAAGSTPSGALTRAPRVNPASVFNPKDAPATPPPGAPTGFSEFLTWMKAMEGGNAPEPEAPAGGRTLIPKEQKKFSRRTNEPAKPATPAVARAEGAVDQPAVGGATSVDKPASAAPVSVPADFLHVERKRRVKDTAQADPGTRLLLQGLVFALLVASFFFGRATVRQVAATALAAPGAPLASKDKGTSGLLPPELLAKVDDAVTAEYAGDIPRALELLESIKDSGAHLSGLDYHLALLYYGNSNLAKVLPLLNESISEGEETAASYNLRGTVINRQSGSDKGMADFELAAKLDPFNARYSFFLGEALRRAGKPQAALVALRQALHRLREPTLESTYMLKIRLAQLEIGQESEFKEEMTARLATTPPPLDWVLTAAAVELHHGNFPAAEELLDKAHGLVPERELLMRLRDYFFYSFSDRKELQRFFAPINGVAVPAPPGGTIGQDVAPFVPQSPPRTPLLDAPEPIKLSKKP